MPAAGGNRGLPPAQQVTRPAQPVGGEAPPVETDESAPASREELHARLAELVKAGTGYVVHEGHTVGT